MRTLLINPKLTMHQTTIGYYLKLFLILMATILFSACSNDDDVQCLPGDVDTEDVVTVDAPETAQVNETIDIEVFFDVRNSCGEFNRFIETGTPMEREIQVESRYEGCNCSQVIETISAIYEFTPEEAGEYTLNFRSGANEFITADISVTE